MNSLSRIILFAFLITILINSTVCFPLFAQDANKNRFSSSLIVDDSANNEINSFPGAYYSADYTLGKNKRVDISGYTYLSLSEALQGKFSGLDATPTGIPGNGGEILMDAYWITGNTQPLIVVDGFPLEYNDRRYNYLKANSMSQYGAMLQLSLNDIESIEVIQSQAARALYGSDGVDGVVIINTKNTSNKKINITYQTDAGIQLKTDFPEMLDADAYKMLIFGAYHNMEGIIEIPDLEYLMPEPDDPNYYNFNQNTNWLDEIRQNGYTGREYLNIDGKINKTRYFVSFELEKHQGEIINTSSGRTAEHLRIIHAFSDKFSLSLNAFLNQRSIKDIYELESNILRTALLKNPHTGVFEYNSEGVASEAYFTYPNFQKDPLVYYNPVALAEEGKSEKKLNDLQTMLCLKYDAFPWLKLEERVTWNNNKAFFTTYLPNDLLYSDMIDGFIEDSLRILQKGIMSETSFLLKLKDQAAGKYELSLRSGYVMHYAKMDYKLNIDPFRANDKSKLENAIYNMLKISIQDRYSVEFFNKLEEYYYLRLDSKKWDVNNGLSLSWNFTEESSLKNLKSFFEGRIYGEIANINYHKDQFDYFSPYGESAELNTAQLGMELLFFDSRFKISGEAIQQDIKKIKEFSVSQIYELRNRSLQFDMYAKLIRKGNFSWNINTNLTYNTLRNVHVDQHYPTFEYQQQFFLGEGNFISGLFFNEASPGDIHGMVHQGIFPDYNATLARNEEGALLLDENGNPFPLAYLGANDYQPGDVHYDDQNYDGTLDLNDVVYLGNLFPKYVGAMNNEFNYKSFSLALDLYFRFSYQIINQTRLEIESMNSLANQSVAISDRWRVPGDDAENLLHRPVMYSEQNNLGSDKYIENGGFIRLNYIHLAYTIPQQLCRQIFADNLTISLSVKRIYTHSSYSGFNPELSRILPENERYIADEVRIPAPKAISLSIRAGF